MKLVDIPDLKSGAERRAGSIPAPGTRLQNQEVRPILRSWPFCFLGCNQVHCSPVAPLAINVQAGSKTKPHLPSADPETTKANHYWLASARLQPNPNLRSLCTAAGFAQSICSIRQPLQSGRYLGAFVCRPARGQTALAGPSRDRAMYLAIAPGEAPYLRRYQRFR